MNKDRKKNVVLLLTGSLEGLSDVGKKDEKVKEWIQTSRSHQGGRFKQ